MAASKHTAWWLCLALVGCASPPERHRGPIDAADAMEELEALNLSPELAESFVREYAGDTTRRLARVRLELRGGLLRAGDRIDVLADEDSEDVVLWSLRVVGHDSDRRWATLLVREDEALLLVARPSPLEARLNDPHATPELCCPEETGSDVIPLERRERRAAERAKRR